MFCNVINCIFKCILKNVLSFFFSTESGHVYVNNNILLICYYPKNISSRGLFKLPTSYVFHVIINKLRGVVQSGDPQTEKLMFKPHDHYKIK